MSEPQVEYQELDPDDQAFITEYYKCKRSPLYWMVTYCKILDQKGRWQKFKPNHVQREIYRELKAKFWKPYEVINGETFYRFQQVRLIIVKYRQIGASTIFILIILWDSLFWSNTKSLIVLHKKESSAKKLEDLKNIYKEIEGMRPAAQTKDYDNKSEFMFEAIGSKITVGTPGMSEDQAGDQNRGDTLNNALLSEMPRYKKQEAFMQALIAAIKYGNIFNESTPLVKGDLYHNTFKDGREGKNEYLAMFFPWFSDPRNEIACTEEEAKEIMANLSESEALLVKENPGKITAPKIKYRRWSIINEYFRDERRFIVENPEHEERCFSGSGHCYFEDPNIEIKIKTCEGPTPPVPGRLYIMGVDIAEGLGGDNDSNSIQVFDPVENKQVFEWDSNTFSYKLMHNRIYEINKVYPSLIGVERNNLGEHVMAMLRNDKELAQDKVFQWMVYGYGKKKDGWYTGQEKPVMISQLYTAIKEAAEAYGYGEPPENPVGLRVYSPGFIQQMGVFLDLGGGKFGAQGTGNHDDRIIALAIAWYLRKYYHSYLRKYRQLTEVNNG